MSDIIDDILAANRAAVTKLIPRARLLSHVADKSDPAYKRELRAYAEAIYLAERAVDAEALTWAWSDEEEPADWGDGEPLAEDDYSHESLLLTTTTAGFDPVVDSLGGIILPHHSHEEYRLQYQDQMAVENRDVIATIYLAHEAARSRGK